VPTGVITLAPPPKVDQLQQGLTGWLQYLFPVVGSLGAMLFIVNNPKPLYLASGLMFMVGSVGMGVGMAVQQRTVARRRTRRARTQYLEYLDQLRRQLSDTAAAQLKASAWRHAAPEALLSIRRSPARVWTRRPDDVDFLQVRVGEGTRPLATPLNVAGADGPAAAVDPVCAAAVDELVQAHGTVAGDAIAVDLKAERIVSVVGTRSERLDLSRVLVCQLAAMHAPDDVRLVLMAKSSDAADWDWIKWLPHLDAEGAEGQRAGSWLVVIADGTIPTPQMMGALRKDQSRTSLIVLAGSHADEPGDIDARLRVAARHLDLEHFAATAATEQGRADSIGLHGAEAIARQLAPLGTLEETGTGRLASDIPLTSLLGIQHLDKLDPRATTWRARPLSQVLSIPIGVSSEGDPVQLDLKESALGGDGPHGLVIGATGSGKSELLRTIVTGLALTHPPDRLAFVLVDFKGGAAFTGLQELPHVAGLITNLADDLALIDRMHAALFGEIRRRQELLKAAGNLATVRDYHHKLEADNSLAPLPYLLVIVDEFGELLTARPEFIDLFVAVGRLGRSLGMHLLLASQQLDEGRLRGLEGHLSYRIAMRTFSAAESRAVLGVADAYELPPLPGSAYLKVGTTVYTRFRAAEVSQPYRVVTETAPDVRARPFYLSLEKHASQSPPSASGQSPEATMLDLAVSRLKDAAPRVHQVWLPPLEPRVSLDAVLGEGAAFPKLVVRLGLIDKPADQMRGVLTADMSGSAGHLLVVGASLTGKTTLLRTLVSSIALTHSPLEAQVYCIDYGGGLSPLAALPHVGSVAGRQDPERIRRIVVEVAAMLDDREARFAAAGIDSPAALRARREGGELEGPGWADVFLVVDNWPAVRQEFEDVEPLLQEVAARGLGYAVHLVLTASRWIDVRSSLREATGGRLELRLFDPAESAINRREAANVAKGVPGRGITAESLHFQTALPRIDGSVEVLDQQKGLEDLIEKVNASWSGPRAAPVLVLPRIVELADLLGAQPARGIVIGVSERDLEPVYIDPAGDPHFVVFGDGESGKTNFLRTYILGLIATSSPQQAQVLLIDYRRTLLGVVPPDYLLGYGGAEPAAAAQVAEAAAVLTRRLPPPDVSIDQLRARSWWKGPEVHVVADDYDLIATPSGGPMRPLLPLLAQAKDVGLHIIIARQTGGAGRGILEPLLLRLRELGSPGLLLSGDPQEGQLLGLNRAVPQPPGRGLLVRRREKPTLVQVAFSGPASS
jgi:S-DNA-T family DNA segregation ATPase FtsK/SpoIIIE